MLGHLGLAKSFIKQNRYGSLAGFKFNRFVIEFHLLTLDIVEYFVCICGDRYLEAVHSLEKGLELVTRGAHPEDDLALMPGTTDRINDIEPLDQLKVNNIFIFKLLPGRLSHAGMALRLKPTLINWIYFIFSSLHVWFNSSFQKTLADLLSECRNPPEPAAVCRYEQCEENAQIYPTDPEFRVQFKF